MTVVKPHGIYILNNQILRKRLIRSLERKLNDEKTTLRKTLLDETEKMINELKIESI